MMGVIVDIEAHRALIPVRVTSLEGVELRPNDSLPMKGPKVQAQPLKDVMKIAE